MVVWMVVCSGRASRCSFDYTCSCPKELNHLSCLVDVPRGLEDADAVNVFEHVHEPLNGMDGEGEVHGPVPVIEKLFPDSFRGGNGTQVRTFGLPYRL